MNQSTILHIEDELEIRELVSLYFKKEGFQLFEALTAKEAFEMLPNVNPQLILLDVHLPDLDGFEVCRRLREQTKAPILFLSCKDTEMDRVIGLSVGGDDYIGKPFSMNELLARVKAHLRRYEEYQVHTKEIPRTPNILRSSKIQLHIDRFECLVDGKEIQLSSKEFELLEFFMRHPFQVLSTEHLLQQVWGYEAHIDTKTVAVHIGNLRRKIGDDPRKPTLLLNLRGVGYKFNDDVF